MIAFEPGTEFLAALPLRYRIGDEIEACGVKGRIVEEITYEDYLDAWASRGFAQEAIGLQVRFYYRCTKL